MTVGIGIQGFALELLFSLVAANAHLRNMLGSVDKRMQGLHLVDVKHARAGGCRGDFTFASYPSASSFLAFEDYHFTEY
ncbi:hypothetical protein M434DRAFT_38978 [Hypoxylon sp. CO27-5]|nr:hypothetical protein M434DRAFT_38978 [Hypoxylon sp. CO27-5]